MGGEGRGIVRDADADDAAVMGRVVNAVGDVYAAGIRAEVVIVDQNGRAIPFGAGVKVATPRSPFATQLISSCAKSSDSGHFRDFEGAC